MYHHHITNENDVTAKSHWKVYSRRRGGASPEMKYALISTVYSFTA